jgi:2-dehydro-3-deoxygluconokinase
MLTVTFGEVMLRLMPPHQLRLAQSLPGAWDATFGGAEVNVAVSIAQQGGRAAYCTALPQNPITDAFRQELRRLGVDDSRLLLRKEGRFGIYFVESGANQRGGTVTYDRAGSTISVTPAQAYDWTSVLHGATWFHVTGITPSLSAAAAEATQSAVEAAAALNIPVSCDLNFRKKLWNWDPSTPPAVLAKKTMERLLPFVSLVIANEEDAEQVLGIHAANTQVDAGVIDPAAYSDVARQIGTRFPRVQKVAITLRESYSASHNNWGAMLYDVLSQQSWLAPLDAQGQYRPYEIKNIVDRVGAGDSFGGGLIFALQTPELSAPDVALRYAVAASCLKHSIVGDFNYSTRAEIEALMGGSGSGRVNR